MTYLMAFEQNTKSTLAITILNKVKNWLLGREVNADNEIIILQSVCKSIVGGEDFNFFNQPITKIVSDNTILIKLGKAIDHSLLQQKKDHFFELIDKLALTKNVSKISKVENNYLVEIIRDAIQHIDNNMINHEVSFGGMLEVKGF